MPITYDIDRDQRLVVATAHGRLTDADVFGYQEAAWSGPETRGFDELVDMTAVSEIEFVSSERLSELARLARSMDDEAAVSKLAIVAVSDFHFGLARMYQSHRELTTSGTKTVAVFRSRAEALEWLRPAARPAR